MTAALTGALALACWRWWYWKQETYRTRDAAIQTFKTIEEELTR